MVGIFSFPFLNSNCEGKLWLSNSKHLDHRALDTDMTMGVLIVSNEKNCPKNIFQHAKS